MDNNRDINRRQGGKGYRALLFTTYDGEVHGKVEDYISWPNFNGYQSLHAEVMGDGKEEPMKVKILWYN